MILWVCEKERSTSYLFSQHLKVQIHQTKIICIQNNEEVFLRVSQGIKTSKQKLSDGQEAIISKENGDVVCKLFLVGKEWNTQYQKYKITQKFSIGADKSNTIQIPYGYIPPIWIEIDPKEKTIVQKQPFSYAAWNQKTLAQNVSYDFLDVLSIANIRMIFMEDGIVINAPVDVKVHLQEYFFHETLGKLKQIPHCEKIYNKTPPFPKPFTFHETIQQNYTIEPVHKPFLLESGSTLLMAIASLSVGLISSYLAYTNGREWITLIPMLVLPCVMLLSVSIFQPLTRFYERKQHQKKMKEIEAKQNETHDRCKTLFLQYKLTYETYMNTYYPDLENLCYRIFHGQDLLQHNTFKLRCGYKKGNLPVDVLEIYQQDIAQEEQAFLIDFEEYPCLSLLHIEKAEYVLQYLILQIVAFHDIPLMIYAEKNWIQQRPWLRFIENTFYGQERFITSEKEKLEEWLQIMEEGKFILLAQKNYFCKMQNAYQILVHPDQKYSALTIDIENHTIYDHHIFQEFPLKLPDVFSFDMYYAMQCVKSKRLCYRETDFFSIHQIQQFNFEENWKENDINTSLKAILGIDEDGKQILLDLNEKEDGPHGLIAGMTGSGKSALLITMLLSLATQYSYEDVQFAMIDFKGGGASASLQQLPHMVATLSNLDTENLCRALVSFQNECLRRQKLLAEMNAISEDSINEIQTYRKHLESYPQFPKIADLLIVVDEFAELKKQRGDFLDDLISISRIGRSLGIHLILCTQRPTGSISEEIWANCGFKIALRVAEASDLQEVLHRKCENTLHDPGDFYLLSRRGLKKGKCAYAGAPYYKQAEAIHVLECDGSIQEYNNSLHLSQQQVLLRAFQKYAYPSKQPLWLSPIELKEKNREAFAMIDDYYNGKQYPLSLFQKRNTVLLSMDIQERELCFLNIVDCMLSQRMPFFVVDDMHMDVFDAYQACPHWITYCDSSKKEWIQNILHFIQKDKTQEKVLIITDISRFQSLCEKFQETFRDCLEHAELYHVHIVVFTSTVSGISYRDFSYMQNRLCLKNENIQEIQQFLETNEKIISTEHGKGLLKKEHVLSFTMFAMSCKGLVEKMKMMYCTQKKLFRIPYMPEAINRHLYRGEEIPIGISYQDYHWLTLSAKQSFYVVSEYKEEWVVFYRCMKRYAKCTMRGEKEEDDGQLIFLSSQEYRQKHEDYPVLYIGLSFSRQYMFYSKYTIQDERDAILFRNFESERLRVV